VRAAIKRLLRKGEEVYFQLRARLVLLVLLAVIPALILTLYTGIAQKQRAAEQANREFLNVMKLTAAEQERMIDGARQLLGVLVHLPEVRSLEPTLCDPLLSKLLKQNPLYANFGIADRDGMIICSGLPFSPPVSIADRLWFQRAVKTRVFAVGDFQISRTAKMPTVHFSLPFFDDDGNILGVAFAALDLNWVKQLLARARLPEGTVSSVVDTSGKVLARSADSEKWVGQSVADTPLLKTVFARPNGGTVESAGIDGVTRLHAFTPLKESGGTIAGYLILGIPSAVAYADANRMMVRSLVFLGAVGAFAVMAAWVLGGAFVLRRTKELISAANRLRAGDLTSRTRPDHRFGEFTTVASAFDEMAEALQQRIAELEKTHAELKQHREHLEELVSTRTAALKESNEQLSAEITERKKVEGALRQAVADLQKAQEELKSAEMLLIQSEKMETIGRMAAGVAHEVKNPLAILLMSLDYLSIRLPADDAALRDVLDDMRKAVNRADIIIRGLLDFSAPNVLNLEKHDVNKLIDKAIMLVTHLLSVNHIERVEELGDGLPQLTVDGSKIEQVFVNLFTNAIDAMPDGGTLTVRTRLEKLGQRSRDPGNRDRGRFQAGDTIVLIEIEDTGCGIPPDKLRKVFDPFFTTKETGKGTGLGLTVASRIIEMHEGDIEISNRPEGGLRARVILKSNGARNVSRHKEPDSIESRELTRT
jgi:signal transduction histidine kinase